MNDVAAAVMADAGTQAHPPVWNLSDLYGGPEAVELDRDLKQALDEARAFRGDFEGKLGASPGAGLGSFIEEHLRFHARHLGDARRLNPSREAAVPR